MEAESSASTSAPAQASAHARQHRSTLTPVFADTPSIRGVGTSIVSGSNKQHNERARLVKRKAYLFLNHDCHLDVFIVLRIFVSCRADRERV